MPPVFYAGKHAACAIWHIAPVSSVATKEKEKIMDRDTKNRILDDAIREIEDHRGSMATLVSVLSHVFSEGYRYGLHQGHVDNEMEG